MSNWKDFGHIIVIGEQIFAAILSVEAGGTGSIEVSLHGKKYQVAVTPEAV